jgi:hypothetical protein
MRRERIERKPAKKPNRHLDVLPLDPRDPDIVRVKRSPVWRFADRRWAV